MEGRCQVVDLDLGPATAVLQGESLGCQQPDCFHDVSQVHGTGTTNLSS